MFKNQLFKNYDVFCIDELPCPTKEEIKKFKRRNEKVCATLKVATDRKTEKMQEELGKKNYHIYNYVH